MRNEQTEEKNDQRCRFRIMEKPGINGKTRLTFTPEKILDLLPAQIEGNVRYVHSALRTSSRFVATAFGITTSSSFPSALALSLSLTISATIPIPLSRTPARCCFSWCCFSRCCFSWHCFSWCCCFPR